MFPVVEVVAFGFVPVSLIAVIDGSDGGEEEGVPAASVAAAAAAVDESDGGEDEGVPPAASAAAAAAVVVEGGGAARFRRLTTLEYCCISITAASNNT